MLKYFLASKRCLDLILAKDDANIFRQSLEELLQGRLSENFIDLQEWGRPDKRVRLRLILGEDDFIAVGSDGMDMIFDRETCEYAVGKLDKFLKSGEIFPAELQSFEIVKSNSKNIKNIMIYMHSEDAYHLGGNRDCA